MRSRRSPMPWTVSLTAALAVAALSLAGCAGGSSEASGGDESSSAEAPVDDVRFSYASTSPLASVVAAQELDTWDEQGIEVGLDEVPDVGTATDLTIGKKAQFGHSAPTTAFAAMSQGVPITIIAGLGFGHGDHQAGFLTSLPSSGITSIADLEGKTVSVTGIGTSYDYLLRAALQREGLDPEKDVTIVPVPYPQARGALKQGQVDAALLLAIDYAALDAEDNAVSIATTAELADAPIEITGVVVAREDWLEGNHEAVVRFLAGLVAAESATSEDVANNGAEDTIDLLQPVLKYDDATLEAYKEYRLEDIGEEPDLGGLLRVPESFVSPTLESLQAGGGLPGDAEVTFDSAVDLSFLKEAYERAGIEWNDDVTYP